LIELRKDFELKKIYITTFLFKKQLTESMLKKLTFKINN